MKDLLRASPADERKGQLFQLGSCRTNLRLRPPMSGKASFFSWGVASPIFGLRPPMSGKAVPFRHGSIIFSGSAAVEAEPPIILDRAGKAQPFRSSGGEAAILTFRHLATKPRSYFIGHRRQSRRIKIHVITRKA